MDAEEARKALDLARKHDANGNTESALKWARKSVAIYTTPEATTLVSRLETQGSRSVPSGSAGKAPEKEDIYTSTTTRTTTTQAQGSTRKYTEKQAEIVRRVKRAGGDFYSVLNLEKSAQEGDVKKSYKKVRASPNAACVAVAS